MARVLVKTDNPSWFVDVANPEGKKVRKGKDDQVFDNLFEGQQALAVLQAAHGPDAGSAGNGDAPENAGDKQTTRANGNRGTDAAKEAVRRTPAQTTVLSSGKPVTGKTVTIRCEWKGKDDGDGTSGNRCKNERTIKVQDKFQVKYCLHHQKRARQLKVNARNRAKTAAKKKEAAKAKA